MTTLNQYSASERADWTQSKPKFPATHPFRLNRAKIA